MTVDMQSIAAKLEELSTTMARLEERVDKIDRYLKEDIKQDIEELRKEVESIKNNLVYRPTRKELESKTSGLREDIKSLEQKIYEKINNVRKEVNAKIESLEKQKLQWFIIGATVLGPLWGLIINLLYKAAVHAP